MSPIEIIESYENSLKHLEKGLILSAPVVRIILRNALIETK